MFIEPLETGDGWVLAIRNGAGELIEMENSPLFTTEASAKTGAEIANEGRVSRAGLNKPATARPGLN